MAIERELDGMADRVESPTLICTAHAFSDSIVTGTRFGGMRIVSRGTNIALGFEAMIASIDATPSYDHCIIVFISDGEDMRDNEARRALLTPLRCKSTLLTVAVGSNFPTSLVVDELRVKYHTFGGDSIPLVFPLPNEHDTKNGMLSDIQWAIQQLEAIILSGGTVQEVSLQDLAQNVHDHDAIIRQCKNWYNACTIQCMSKALEMQEKVDLVLQTKENFNHAEEIMRKGLESLSKPSLPSNLRARRPLFHLTSMREHLNQLLHQFNNGRVFEKLSDIEKQDYLTFGNVTGHLFATAFKYKSADFNVSKASLLRHVNEYQTTDADEALMDQINLCSQAEYFVDAHQVLKEIEEAHTLAGILQLVPFIGRGVELHALPACGQINAWCGAIKTLPTTFKLISTHDLFNTYGGNITLRDDKANAIILCGGNPKSPGIFTHVQSFILAKNMLLYLGDARLAAASMLLVYLLGHCDGALEEWKVEELAHVRTICAFHTPENSSWWYSYLNCLKSSDFRKCLVTESVKLDKSLTCPGLGKFLLGTWWLAEHDDDDHHHSFTEQDLLDRYEATIVELIGRCNLKMEDFFVVKRPPSRFFGTMHPAMHALDMVEPSLRTSHLSIKQLNRLLHQTLFAKIRATTMQARKDMTITFKADYLQKQVHHFHLTLQNVQYFFAGLLERECGVKWSGPSEETLMRALLIATAHRTSYDRNHPTFFTQSTHEELLRTVFQKMSGRWNVYEEIMSEARKAVLLHLETRHLGLPRPIPRKHVLRYQEETGLDIEATWQINQETRLSPVACCFPACDLYLVIPTGDDDRKKRAIIRDHFHSCCSNSIPGLHLSVVRHKHRPTQDIISIIKSGAELGEPFLPREVTKRLAKGMHVVGGIPRSFASPEEYRKHCLEQELQARPAKIAAAIKDFTGGDGIVLFHTIDDLKISLEADSWSYSAFKRTFDLKYANQA